MKFITDINALTIDEKTFLAAMPTNKDLGWKIFTPQGCFIVEVLDKQKDRLVEILVDDLGMTKGITKLSTIEEEDLDLDVRWEDGTDSEVYYKSTLPIITFPDVKIIIVTEQHEITIKP